MHVGYIAVAVAPAESEAPHFVGTIAPQWGALGKTLGRLGPRERLQIVYEAGPCGYALARQLRAQGYTCDVIAPTETARRPGDRIKDRSARCALARPGGAGRGTGERDNPG